MGDQGDFFGLSGEHLKQYGMALVHSHQSEEWKTTARYLVLTYLRNKGPCLMEEAKEFCFACGLPEPNHHNAWGALTNSMHIAGDIMETGEWRKSKLPKSHSRRNPVIMAKRMY